jgi:hypothetical protein
MGARPRLISSHRKQIVDAGQVPRACPPDLTADEQVLFDRERGEQPAPFRNERDTVPDHLMRGPVSNWFAVEQDGLTTRSDGPRDTIEQRRFPGAIGADDGHHLARRHAERNAEQRLKVAVKGVERPHIEQRFRHRRGFPCRFHGLRPT